MALTLCFLLLLGLSGTTVSEGLPSPTKSPDVLEFELPAMNYETKDSYDAGPIGGLFQMVRVFLHVVQPNPFPEGKCRLWEKPGFVSKHTCTCTMLFVNDNTSNICYIQYFKV